MIDLLSLHAAVESVCRERNLTVEHASTEMGVGVQTLTTLNSTPSWKVSVIDFGKIMQWLNMPVEYFQTA